jgi:hypothetical protein
MYRIANDKLLTGKRKRILPIRDIDEIEFGALAEGADNPELPC